MLLQGDHIKIAVVVYSTQAFVEFDFNDHDTKEEIIRAMGAIKYAGLATNTAAALKTCRKKIFTRENGDRPDAKNLIILATDGVSNIGKHLTIPEANYIKDRMGIPIYGIGIGKNLSSDHSELDQIVSQPTEEWIQLVPSYKLLKEKVLTQICKSK